MIAIRIARLVNGQLFALVRIQVLASAEIHSIHRSAILIVKWRRRSGVDTENHQNFHDIS